jgi:DNA-binding NtrC family response regulator
VVNAFRIRDLTREVSQLRETVLRASHFDNIISNDGAMEEVLKLIHKAKDSDISVLVTGESGTGKELIARAIHFNGKRRNGPFVAVNCAAIPKDLIESEMFGHEKGSFTGAHQRKIGKFEQANGGTIFLDEIGELDMNLQAKLLRAIQTRQFERVGGNELITVDVRIISATNKDLVQASRDREFREDLYYRLGSFPILLPPLRQRRGDILLIAEHFLARFSKEQGKHVTSFARKALKILYDYPWPGNVRELESAIERAVLLADGDAVNETDLPLAVRAFAQGENTIPLPSSLFDNQDSIIPLETVKEQAVKHALKVTEGNILDAARKLGISRSTLYELMKKYELKAA